MNTNQTTNHEAFRDDLKAFLDNELTGWRHMQVRRHIAGCADCRMELQEMSQISKQLQAEHTGAPTEETTLDAGLRSRILGDAPVADRTYEIVPTTPARSWRLRWKDWVLLGGVTSFLFVSVMSTMGKKVQTVFNVANNALTTSDYAAAPGSQSDADDFDDAPSGAVAPPSMQVAPRENARRSANSLAKGQRGQAAFGVPTTDSVDTSRRVHKEASIGVAVKNAEVASDAVVKLVQGAGGYILGNTLTSAGDDSKNAAMEIRVPVARFDGVLRQIGELGEVKTKNVSGEDKTEQFSNADQARRILTEDLSRKEAQLRAAKERAERKKKTYVPGWEERAELRNLRIEAAQAKARLELLRKTTDLSNISVQLQEKATPPGEAGFWQSLNDTKMDAAKSFVNAARLPMACLIWILAYSPLWLPALLVWRYFNKAPRNVT